MMHSCNGPPIAVMRTNTNEFLMFQRINGKFIPSPWPPIVTFFPGSCTPFVWDSKKKEKRMPTPFTTPDPFCSGSLGNWRLEVFLLFWLFWRLWSLTDRGETSHLRVGDLFCFVFWRVSTVSRQSQGSPWICNRSGSYVFVVNLPRFPQRGDSDRGTSTEDLSAGTSWDCAISHRKWKNNKKNGDDKRQSCPFFLDSADLQIHLSNGDILHPWRSLAFEISQQVKRYDLGCNIPVRNWQSCGKRTSEMTKYPNHFSVALAK